MNRKPELSTIIQHPTDLIFSVIDHDISHLLTVLETDLFYWKDYEFRFSIIGESHCVSVKYRDHFLFQEVLACTNLPAILQADSHKFDKLETYEYKKKQYQSIIQFDTYFQKQEINLKNLIRLDFPEVYGIKPYTQITWDIQPVSVRWFTTHIYPLPTDTIYVYTESLFGLMERSKDE